MYTRRCTCIHTIYTPLTTSNHPIYTSNTPLHGRYADKLGGLQSEEAALEATRGELVASEAEAGMRMRAGALSKNLLARQVRLKQPINTY